jgi:hypothetical protein
MTVCIILLIGLLNSIEKNQKMAILLVIVQGVNARTDLRRDGNDFCNYSVNKGLLSFQSRTDAGSLVDSRRFSQ